MNGNYRGGNSRLLAKQLDASPWPIVWLQNSGEIVFANAAMCDVAASEATELVGLKCIWQLPPDGLKHGPLLAALAPPVPVMQGQAFARQIPWPPTNPSEKIEQHFIPFAQHGSPDHHCLVIHSADRKLAFPVSTSGFANQPTQDMEWLLRLRSQWSQLDGLLPLYGTSPPAQFAMRRVQLAMVTSESLFVSGPAGAGKIDILRAIFAGRLKNAGRPYGSGRFFPIDCSSTDASLLEEMLEVFQSLKSPELPPQLHLLVLERIDLAGDLVVDLLNRWMANSDLRCCCAATSRCAMNELAARGDGWRWLLSRIGTIDIEIPSIASRREDIMILVQQSIALACTRTQRPPLIVSAAAMDLLTAYTWPENMAELHKFANEIISLGSTSAAVQPHHLPLAIRTFGSTVLQKQTTVEPIELDKVLTDIERIMIERALKLSPRNRAQAARWLGISRPRLLRRIQELGLSTSLDDVERPEDE